MKLLKEMLVVLKEAKIAKTTAAAVYHRDYVKTKNKKYRRYDPRRRHKKQDHVNESSSLADVGMGFDYHSFTLQELEQELSHALRELRDMRATGEEEEDMELIKNDIRDIRAALELKRAQIAASAL